MKKLLKWVFVLAAVGGALYTASYAGARARAGTFLGSRLPDMGARTVYFAFKGTPDLPGNPRAWVVRYYPTKIPGAPDVRVYVGPTGKLLSYHPTDIEDRIKPFQEILPD